MYRGVGIRRVMFQECEITTGETTGVEDNC